jgi:hypothetical protein
MDTQGGLLNVPNGYVRFTVGADEIVGTIVTPLHVRALGPVALASGADRGARDPAKIAIEPSQLTHHAIRRGLQEKLFGTLGERIG